MAEGPNGGTADIATDGRLRQLETELARLDERMSADQKAIALQAREYARRLDSLNHAHEKAVEVQHTYVTQEKYEDKLAAEGDARIHALARVDEKLEDFVQRWELRQRETDLTIATLSKAAAEAKQIAENQGRQTRQEADAQAQRQKDAAAEAQRRQTRNITVMGIALAFAVGVANLLPLLLK